MMMKRRAWVYVGALCALFGTGVIVSVSACRERSADDGSEAAPQVESARAELKSWTTAGGVKVEQLALGGGSPAPIDAKLTINFTAMLADGTVFDSTEARKRSLDLALNDPNLIAGLREGLAGVCAGERRRISIPWPLGYGATGRDPVPPKTDLVYEAEIVSINRPGE